MRIKHVIIYTAVFVVFALLVILGLMLFVFFCSKSHKKSDWVNKVNENQPTVLALTVLSAIVNLYNIIIALTSAAIHYWCQIQRNSDLLYDLDIELNLGPSVIAIIFDILCFLAWVAIVIVAGASYGEKCKCLHREYAGVILSSTVLCPFFCIIAHSPYIAIAYLNDGNHASSIFIYYTVLCYIFFGVTWLFFHWCLTYSKKDQTDAIDQHKKEIVSEDNVDISVETDSVEGASKSEKKISTSSQPKSAEDKITKGEIIEEEFRADETIQKKDEVPELSNLGMPEMETNRPQKSFRCVSICRSCFNCCVKNFHILSMILLGVTILFLLGLAVIIVCYFVLIPVNKAISDAPMCVLSIYQSVGFVIGSFIVYKVLDYFYSKNKGKNKDREKK